MAIALIIVLSLILFIFEFPSSVRKDSREEAVLQYNVRKTNALREQEIMNWFMMQGLTKREAYYRSQEQIVEEGFEPCIKLEDYKATHYGLIPRSQIESSSVFNPHDKDSELVKLRFKNGLSSEEVYKDFPTDDLHASWKLSEERRHSIQQLKTLKPGKMISYPGLGTCEILSCQHNSYTSERGYYIVKVYKTGETVSIPCNSNQIVEL